MENVPRNPEETEESYVRRKWLIKVVKPKTKSEVQEAIVLANCWVNMIFLGCVYPISIAKRLKLILSKSEYA